MPLADVLPGGMSQAEPSLRRITAVLLARRIWGSGVGGESEGKEAS